MAKHEGPIICESGIKSEKEVEEIVKKTKINKELEKLGYGLPYIGQSIGPMIKLNGEQYDRLLELYNYPERSPFAKTYFGAGQVPGLDVVPLPLHQMFNDVLNEDNKLYHTMSYAYNPNERIPASNLHKAKYLDNIHYDYLKAAKELLVLEYPELKALEIQRDVYKENNIKNPEALIDPSGDEVERANQINMNELFKSDATDDQVEELLNQTGSRIVDFYPTVNWYLIETLSGNRNTKNSFESSSLVKHVAYDSTLRLTSLNTNDPLINDLWGLDGNHGIDAEVAWPLSSNASEVIVAVIDSGIDPLHPDLSGVLWNNDDEIPNNGIDDDGNGYIDDTYGWDFTGEYDNIPQDGHGHGTHVAGTIAATRNNNEGIAGVANNVKIMGLRFLDKSGNGITSWAINALEYAVANGAVISNNSWGGGPYETPLYNAIAAAGNAGHLFVAAAGNSGNNSDTFPMYPAAYNLPNILSVAAIASNGNLAGFSNYGINSVDIAAPGVDILSTMSSESDACVSNPPCYTSWDGTSMAAPHVTGVAALMLGVNNGLTPSEIIQIIEI